MRKIIVVPIDKAAMDRLDYDQASDEELMQLYLDDAQFSHLWVKGFFYELNNLANIIIDIYEEDCIVDMNVLREVNSSGFFEKYVTAKAEDIVQQIRQLFLEAEKRETGVFFYF